MSLSNVQLRRDSDAGTPSSEVATARLSSLPPASPIRQPVFDDAPSSVVKGAAQAKPYRVVSKGEEEARLPTIPVASVTPRQAAPDRRTVALKAVSVKWSADFAGGPQ